MQSDGHAAGHAVPKLHGKNQILRPKRPNKFSVPKSKQRNSQRVSLTYIFIKKYDMPLNNERFSTQAITNALGTKNGNHPLTH